MTARTPATSSRPRTDLAPVGRPQGADAVLLTVALVAVSTSGPLIAATAVPALAIAFWRNAMAAGVLVPAALLTCRQELRSLDRRERWLILLAGVFLAHRDHMWLAWGGLFLGGVASALVARGVAERPSDAAFGVFYIGIACICLVWLRAMPQGHWWTLMLFAITWTADIAAFAVGSALKGPKLWPRFSPNKTWSGFVGGLVFAMGVGAVMTIIPAFELNMAAGALVGLLGGLATMAGDLWESALKRRFGVKDSGNLIPGHGGLLDRVDGLLFAVVIIAAARLVNHLGWGH